MVGVFTPHGRSMLNHYELLGMKYQALRSFLQSIRDSAATTSSSYCAEAGGLIGANAMTPWPFSALRSKTQK